jgi:hypothetical protein
MGAMLAGSLGVPLTAVLFGLEITHCLPALLPLTLGCVSAYLVTALLMPRSILTEKLSRRGYHLTREYGVDPLELVLVSELMSPADELEVQFRGEKPIVPEVFVYSDGTSRSAAELMATTGVAVLPVVNRRTQLVEGRISIRELLRGRSRAAVRENERLRLAIHKRQASMRTT